MIAGENHLRKTVTMDIPMVNGDLEGTMALFRDDGSSKDYAAMPLSRSTNSLYCSLLAKPSFHF